MGTEEEVVKVDEQVVGVKEVVKARWWKTASIVLYLHYMVSPLSIYLHGGHRYKLHF